VAVRVLSNPDEVAATMGSGPQYLMVTDRVTVKPTPTVIQTYEPVSNLGGWPA
jgi:hypothetical protein